MTKTKTNESVSAEEVVKDTSGKTSSFKLQETTISSVEEVTGITNLKSKRLQFLLNHLKKDENGNYVISETKVNEAKLLPQGGGGRSYPDDLPSCFKDNQKLEIKQAIELIVSADLNVAIESLRYIKGRAKVHGKVFKDSTIKEVEPKTKK